MINKILTLGCAFILSTAAYAQTAADSTIVDQKIRNEVISSLIKKDTTKPVQNQRFLIDGVSSVVGDYVILNSDITKQLDVNRGTTNLDISKCAMMESILQEKMFAHHAIQDSITVSDEEIEGSVEQQLNDFRRRGLTTDESIARFYRRDNIDQVRVELRKINRDIILSRRMQQRLTESIEITPEEVRKFFTDIPEDELPLFNTEVKMAQIIVKPEASQEFIDEAIVKLNRYRTDVLENGSSFAALATLHSDDTGTEAQGGVISMTRNDPYAKEFKDTAFSLQEGEISEPFKTSFGYHILYVEKVRGQVRDVRHILLQPFVSSAQTNNARKELDEIRDKIIMGEMTFADAAKEISDEEETARNGGRLTNPATGDLMLELDKLPSEMASQLQFLDSGDVSGIFKEQNQLGETIFKILYVEEKVGDHIADYARDYIKIKDLALNKKKVELIKKWREEKLKDTYIKIGDDFGDCDFDSTWSK